jgi:hypothetical protein
MPSLTLLPDSLCSFFVIARNRAERKSLTLAIVNINNTLYFPFHKLISELQRKLSEPDYGVNRSQEVCWGLEKAREHVGDQRGLPVLSYRSERGFK